MRLQYTPVYTKEPRPPGTGNGASPADAKLCDGRAGRQRPVSAALFRQLLHDRLRRGEAWLMGDADVNAAGGAG